MNEEEKLLNKIAFELADTDIPFMQGNVNGKVYLAVKIADQPCFNLVLNPVNERQIKLTFCDYAPDAKSELDSDEYMRIDNQYKNKQLIKFLQIINPYLAD